MDFKENVLELFFPTKCPFCHRLTGDSRIKVCEKCISSLPYTQYGAQSQHFPYIAKCVAPVYYEAGVRDSVKRFKFGGAGFYGKIYAKFIAKCIDENAISCDIITWTPISRRRYRKRGYNQAEVIAKELARLLGVPCMPLLKKIKDNPAQSGISDPKSRKANVAGVYESNAPEKVKGSVILIVDDVVTTGATLSECARVLKQSGAGTVYAAAFARHRD